MIRVRIVSLLPSATEILFALGLGDDVVGVTFECNWPPAARTKRIVSTSSLPEGLSPAEIDTAVRQRIAAGEDLYRLDRGAFAEIAPDLVVTQDLCAVCALEGREVEDALAFLGCTATVVTLDPSTLDEVIDTVTTVGAATGTDARAAELVAALRQRLVAVGERVTGAPRPTVLVLEWTDPAFTAGHWVPDLVQAAGGTAVLAAPGGRSQPVPWPAVRDTDADVVLVAPCGFGLDGAADLAADVIARDLLPSDAAVWAVDADALVVRPGPRLVDGVEAIATILHPERCGPPDPGRVRRLR